METNQKTERELRIEKKAKQFEEKMKLAEQNDTRVVSNKTYDTGALLSVAESVDLMVLRLRLLSGIFIEDSTKAAYISELNEIITNLHIFAVKLSTEINFKYTIAPAVHAVAKKVLGSAQARELINNIKNDNKQTKE